jgi:MFS transporter, putative metabolite:H+ symporter
MACYFGFVLGDFGSGLYSQLIRSRRTALQLFIAFNFLATLVYLFLFRGVSANAIYGMCILLGATGGYWAVIITVAAEQFGTNLRATVATAVPNFIRFGVVPMSLSVLALKESMGLVYATLIVASLASGFAFWASFKLKETFTRDLNFVEPI